MDRGELYHELVSYIRRKFASRPSIADISEDIVGDVFLWLYEKHGMDSDKENFGYLSVACIRQAYKKYRAWDITAEKTSALNECLHFLSETDVVEEIMQSNDTEMLLSSLEALKTVEKAIIMGRYYGDLKFSKIAEDMGINLNTVLSHHRRALEKLRPRLSRHFLNN